MIFVRVRSVGPDPDARRGARRATRRAGRVRAAEVRRGHRRRRSSTRSWPAGEAAGRRLLAMPVLEAPEIGYIETRASSLHGARRLLDKYRELVPAVRIGATDLSGAYGLRRARDLTIWDVRVVADVISAVVNVFGRVDAGSFVVTGPVWEYFSATERMFKPQLRESPFVAHEERALRAQLIAADLDGLIREVALDRANGLTGKTVIHPSHVAAVHALSVVAHEEYADASDVLATERRGRRRRVELRQQDEREQAAHRLGAAHAAAGPGVRRRPRGRLVRRPARARVCTGDRGPDRPAGSPSGSASGSTGDPALADLVGLALRRNPRRAHLLVSTVLGKHIPADPRVVHGAGLRLGRLVARRARRRPARWCSASPRPRPGSGTASPRRSARRTCTRPAARCRARAPSPASRRSTATPRSHQLLPDDPALLAARRRARARRRRALDRAHRAEHDRRAARRRARTAATSSPRSSTCAAAATGETDRGVRGRARRPHRRRRARPRRGRAGRTTSRPGPRGAVTAADPALPAAPAGEVRPRTDDLWPADVRESGRHGFGPADVRAARAAASAVADALAPGAGAARPRARHRGADVRAAAVALRLAERGRRRAGLVDHPVAGVRRRRARLPDPQRVLRSYDSPDGGRGSPTTSTGLRRRSCW